MYINTISPSHSTFLIMESMLIYSPFGLVALIGASLYLMPETVSCQIMALSATHLCIHYVLLYSVVAFSTLYVQLVSFEVCLQLHYYLYLYIYIFMYYGYNFICNYIIGCIFNQLNVSSTSYVSILICLQLI